MKKIIISLLLMALPVVMFAQLKVFSTGNVSLKTSSDNPYAYLMVSPSTYTSGYSSYSIGTFSSTYLTNTYNIADNTIRGNSIIVGSDVNTVIPQGSVSVVSGKMTIIGNNVEIRNNYEVNAGAELEITNN